MVLNEIRNLTCIVCPSGCQIEVIVENGEIKKLSGYACPRGKEYAENECVHPVRILTTTVRIFGGEIPLLPVKTEKPVDNNLLMDLMAVMNRVSVSAPVVSGQIIFFNLLKTGVNIVATRSVKRL